MQDLPKEMHEKILIMTFALKYKEMCKRTSQPRKATFEYLTSVNKEWLQTITERRWFFVTSKQYQSSKQYVICKNY